MTVRKAALVRDGQEDITLDIRSGLMGKDALDIRPFGAQELYSYDPGFANTAGCESAITYIDAANSVLLHRGFPVEQLADKCDFTEVCFILLYGEAPSRDEYASFANTITRHTLVHEQIGRMFSGFRRDAHPMALMCAVVGALAAFYHDVLDIDNAEHRELAAVRLLSKMPTLAAMCYKYSVEQPAVYPRNALSYTGNFLHMLFAVPAEKYEVNPVLERAMNRILILHADHGQCPSTMAVRASGSSGANPFACIAAGLSSMWGPLHGGANEACMRMLEEIKTVDRIPAFLQRAKDKRSSLRLMGFGNSIYHHFDPRAAILRKTCHEVLSELGMEDSLLQVAVELEHIAITDPYFLEHKLYPSADFYTAVILKAMGLPSSMFTVISAVGRTVGWIAHWNEMHGQELRIYRPRQVYTGKPRRDYVSRQDK
ncbi:MULTISPECIES: citrate synthase [Brenneria]|uniref:Citrate synthase n=1 Tax=Brenneria nigrifluens DSM 30175 = ATCC 13028 TaxID=1121120 RepID=A0A2U1UTE1_9GAMM|nr:MULTISPECIES: citrate synthase [Brenneria]EHD19821.1 citrate synthase I [Brenneria sp. EniD312]PWC24929.1 citrate synthase [Brenneria nigrifluens] [Brenneria nigrifluens DSM 30175 = ATCC 13028]QCR03075.1 citrate synthase [Brenneria nigrifluens] [Brenneria nigrifluens DSM 30175 = ATCC 13028]